MVVRRALSRGLLARGYFEVLFAVEASGVGAVVAIEGAGLVAGFGPREPVIEEILRVVEAVVVVGVGIDLSPLPCSMLVQKHVDHLDRGRALNWIDRRRRFRNSLLGVLAQIGRLIEGEGLCGWKLWLVRAREGLVLFWSM